MLFLLAVLCPLFLLLVSCRLSINAATKQEVAWSSQSSLLQMIVCLIGQYLQPTILVSMLLFLIPTTTPVAGASSSGCVFPSKHSLIDDKAGEPAIIMQCLLNPVSKYWWCPTTSDYITDKQWKKCPETKNTKAGNDPGKPCHLPFIYNKVPQHACINHSGGDMPYWWCSTTANYDRDRLWTKCKEESGAMPCHFDDSGKGVHNQCRLVDNRWICTTHLGVPRLCPETDKTFGGNDPGAKCAVPFYYRKEEHFECVNSQRNSEGPYKWCATTENYDSDGRWTRCKDNDMHKGLRWVIRIIIIAGGSVGGVIVVGCVLYYACDPVSLLQMTLRKRKPRPTNEVQLQTEDDYQCERNPLTPSAPPPPYEEVCQGVRTYSDPPPLPTDPPV